MQSLKQLIKLKSKENMKKGDYVLATKYNDGDPHDNFCVGFWDGHTKHNSKRHNVIDSDGKLFRHNGFRRVRRISQVEGDYIVNNIPAIEMGDKSLWSILDNYKKELNGL